MSGPGKSKEKMRRLNDMKRKNLKMYNVMNGELTGKVDDGRAALHLTPARVGSADARVVLQRVKHLQQRGRSGCSQVSVR